jgi:hypothetical protein
MLADHQQWRRQTVKVTTQMKTINFVCPNCLHSMVLPVTIVGKKGKCPHCKLPATVLSATPFEPLKQLATDTTQELLLTQQPNEELLQYDRADWSWNTPEQDTLNDEPTTSATEEIGVKDLAVAGSVSLVAVAILSIGIAAFLNAKLFYIISAVLLAVPLSGFKKGITDQKTIWIGLAIIGALWIFAATIVRPAWMISLVLETPIMALTLTATFRLFDPSLKGRFLKDAFLVSLAVIGAINTIHLLVDVGSVLSMPEDVGDWLHWGVWAGAVIYIMRVFEIDTKEMIIVATIYIFVYTSSSLLIQYLVFGNAFDLKDFFRWLDKAILS